MDQIKIDKTLEVGNMPFRVREVKDRVAKKLDRISFLEDKQKFDALPLVAKIKWIHRNPDHIEDIDDPEFILLKIALDKGYMPVKHIVNAPLHIQHYAISVNTGFLQFFENPEKHLIIEAIKKVPESIRYISKPDKELQFLAVMQKPTAIRHIEEPDRDVALYALSQDGYVLNYLTDPDREMIETAIAQNPNMIAFFDSPDKSLCNLAVSNDGMAIQSIKNPDDDIVIAAILQNIEAISLVKKPSRKVFDILIDINSNALTHTKSPLGVQLKALQKNPTYNQFSNIKSPKRETQLYAAWKFPREFYNPMARKKLNKTLLEFEPLLNPLLDISAHEKMALTRILRDKFPKLYELMQE